MKIYITNEPQNRLRNSFSNINTFAIIDVDNIVKSTNLDLTKTHNIFLINSEIEKFFIANCKSKRYKGIIYINSNLNDNIFNNLIELSKKIKGITDLILMDDYDTPKLQKYYHYVEEIMYFSTFKRVKILECKPLNINNDK
jgi:hypothetical protein